jgi:putative chitinase
MVPSALRAINEIDFAGLVGALPAQPRWTPLNNQGRYLTAFANVFRSLARRGVDNPLRLAHFLAQGIFETNYLQATSENLNYSAERLRQIFPRYFPTLEEARAYERNPEKIANRVYANRLGNGDEASGDGYRYRGRGFFQLTGKDNYRYYGDLAGVGLVSNPDILTRDLRTSILVAASYFGKTGLGKYADRNDARAVSRGVNRGDPEARAAAHGEDQRMQWTKIVEGFLTAGGPERREDALEVGDRGEAVRILQENLNILGYPSGTADGIFGRNTRRAVVLFQTEHGLDPNGVVDAETAAAIEDALIDARGAQPASREAATAADLRKAGDREVIQSEQAGAAGAAVGGAAAVGAANETGLLESGRELAEVIIEDARQGGAEEPAPEEAEEAPAPGEAEEAVTEAPAAPPAPAAPAQETNWVVVGLWAALLVLGLFILLRSRGAVRDRVDAHRKGKRLEI